MTPAMLIKNSAVTHLKYIQSVVLVALMASYVHGAPVAHYTFDDSNDRYKDVSGNGYHGTSDGSGTTFMSSGVSGLGDAMNTTTSGRVLVNTPITAVSLSSFAISFWATSGTDWDNWISFGGTDNFFLQQSDNPSIFLQNEGGVAGYTSWDAAAALPGGLNHFVLSANSATETASLYINGTLADTAIWTVSASETLGYLTIGGARSTTVRNIHATIDDVQIYDTSLTHSDVSHLYNSPGSAIPEPATTGLLTLVFAIALFIRRTDRKLDPRPAGLGP